MPRNHLLTRARLAAAACSWLALLIGSWSLLAWRGWVRASWTAGDSGPALTPLTAVAIVGLALHALTAGRRPLQRWSWIGAVVALLIGAYAGLEDLLGMPPGLERWLFSEQLEQISAGFSGRPSPWTAVTIVALGTAQVVDVARVTRLRWVAQAATVVALAVTWTALFGHASATADLYRMRDTPEVGMSWATAIALLLLTCHRVLSVPNPLRSVLLSRTAGGGLARPLLPVSLAVPLLILWLFVHQTSGDSAPRLAVVVSWAVTSMTTAMAVIVICAMQGRAELRNVRDEARREQLLARLKRSSLETARLNRHLEERIAAGTIELRRRAEELEQSNVDLQQFAFVASHDLRTPLRSITGFLQLLRESCGDRLDEPEKEWIERSLAASHRLAELVGSLLAYARVDANASPRSTFDLGATCDQVLDSLSSSIEEAHASITRDELPNVTGDADQIGIVMQNVLENSLRYRRPEEPPRVHVSAQRNGDAWHVTIRDHGIGVPAEQRERVFELFHRLHTHKRHPGAGIGLALARRIVQRHGGNMWMEGVDGAGCAVTFTLPCGEEPTDRS